MSNAGYLGIVAYSNDATAQGVWKLREQMLLKKNSAWPVTQLWVTDGIQLFLDAGNTSSYPGSGFLWTDVSGNSRNVTLSNTTYSSTAGGTLDFNGTSSTTSTVNLGIVSEATFLVWIRRTGASSSYAGLAMSRSTGNTSGLNLFSTNNTIGYHWNDASNTWSWNSGLTIPDNTWTMAAITVDNTKAVAYLNNASTSTNIVSHSATNLSVFKIGEDMGRYFNGDIAVVMIYNRALTSAEIYKNYDYYKARFGL
jgi:hypothetical protein